MNTIPDKIIGLSDLVNKIKDERRRVIFEPIWHLKKAGDEKYKTLKKDLDNITPQCLVSIRNLTGPNFENNFIQFSNYLYFDLDNLIDVDEEKKRVISQYGDKLTLVCKSSSGAGLSMLFKITNKITKTNYEAIKSAFKAQFLSNEITDVNTEDLGRAWFIPFDAEPYINYENSVTVNIIEVNKEMGIDPNSERESSLLRVKPHNSNTSKINYNISKIDVVLENIVLKTIIPVSNPVVEFREELITEVYIPNIIVDGKKRKTFHRILHQLYFLNSEVELDYLFSFLVYVNDRFAKPKMEFIEVKKLFNSTIKGIKKNGSKYITQTIRRVHFNTNNKDLTCSFKVTVAKILNGAYKRSVTIKKIQNAKADLEAKGLKVTNKAIAEIAGLDPGTVGKRIKEPPVDMDYEVSLWN